MIGNAQKITAWLNQERTEHPDREYECKEVRKKRSHDANSYYWTICGQLADILRESKFRVHNRMLARYGQRETLNDKYVMVFIPDTDEAMNEAMEASTYHIWPTSKTETNSYGKVLRMYLMNRPSHTLDSREFSILLDGIISEAKGQGIETLPPAELEKMKAELRKQEEKKHGRKE